MIHIEATIKYAGYDPRDLSRGSNKRVCCVCDVCGKVRWTAYKDYRDLCHLCASRTEETRRKIGDGNRGKVVSEEGRINMSNVKKGKVFSKEHCRRIGDARKGKLHTEKSKKQMSESTKGQIFSEETRRLMSERQRGEKHWNWKGGISFEPYCHKFDDAFKEMVREKFGRLCFMCNMNEEENGKKLSVHHVNYDKECMCNEKECEFVPLCIGCHTITNYGREMWEKLIINVMCYEEWI